MSFISGVIVQGLRECASSVVSHDKDAIAHMQHNNKRLLLF